MSVYNITSPILSLLVPIFILIIPFFILKVKCIAISMKEYLNVLNKIIANHAIVKIFTKFHEVDFSQKIYILVSAAFYVFNIYQNNFIMFLYNNPRF
jgi:hypothetical protein